MRSSLDHRVDRAVSNDVEAMRRLSSRTTFVTKRVFPVFWFGMVGIFFGVTVYGTTVGRSMPLPAVLAPVFMAVVGYLVMKHLVFDLVDEVWDAGQVLIVRNGGREDRVDLRDVVNVSYTIATNPRRVTLTLRRPSGFGPEISFVPPATWNPFARSPIVAELIERVDEARRAS
jgi:hypothetical protein